MSVLWVQDIFKAYPGVAEGLLTQVERDGWAPSAGQRKALARGPQWSGEDTRRELLIDCMMDSSVLMLLPLSSGKHYPWLDLFS